MIYILYILIQDFFLSFLQIEQLLYFCFSIPLSVKRFKIPGSNTYLPYVKEVLSNYHSIYSLCTNEQDTVYSSGSDPTLENDNMDLNQTADLYLTG